MAEKLNDNEVLTRIKRISESTGVTENYVENLKNVGIHPCYSEQAHFSIARIHLPVAPLCNIQCNYCQRAINKIENRPGVTNAILTPAEALDSLNRTLESRTDVKVVGVAGPGEPLANPETFETFRLIRKAHPELILCIATNGLLLPTSIEPLVDSGVGNVTVTVNGINPNVLKNLYSFIIWEGKRYTGEEAGKILVQNQLKGIELASQRGILIRINTVLVPTINDQEIEHIAQETSSRGAVLHNIIPLIPFYAFSNLKRPTHEEMTAARLLSGRFLPQFTLCKQCRADAIGIPGKEGRCGHKQNYVSSTDFHG